jgi:hypothetical protein
LEYKPATAVTDSGPNRRVNVSSKDRDRMSDIVSALAGMHLTIGKGLRFYLPSQNFLATRKIEEQYFGSDKKSPRNSPPAKKKSDK